jgi:hypothetical protein
MTDAKVIGRIDQLLNTQTFGEIAATLNKSGSRSGKAQRFTSRYIAAFKGSTCFARGLTGSVRSAC